MSETLSSYPSIGRKIERIRKLKGIKQETLAKQLGMTHQAISKMEQSETIDEEKLERVAEALGMTAEAIKNFNEEAVVQIISNIFNDNAILNGYNFQPTFNPIDKLVELYERMLELEREKIEILKTSQASSSKK